MEDDHFLMECVGNDSSTEFSSFPVPNVAVLTENNDTFIDTFQMPHSSSNVQSTSLVHSQSDDFEIHSETMNTQRLNESNEAAVSDRSENQPLEAEQNPDVIVLRSNNTIPRLGRGRSVSLQLIEARRILGSIRRQFRYIQQINRLLEPDSLANLPNRKKSKYTKKGSQKTSFHKYMLFMQNVCTSNAFQNNEKVHSQLIKKRQSH